MIPMTDPSILLEYSITLKSLMLKKSKRVYSHAAKEFSENSSLMMKIIKEAL